MIKADSQISRKLGAVDRAVGIYQEAQDHGGDGLRCGRLFTATRMPLVSRQMLEFSDRSCRATAMDGEKDE